MLTVKGGQHNCIEEAVGEKQKQEIKIWIIYYAGMINTIHVCELGL